MKAVFSFYSQPYKYDVLKNKSNWASNEYEFIVFAWAVSRAKLQFDSVELVTDAYGKWLMGVLGITFDSIVLFDNIEPYGGKLWAAGKIIAYSKQTTPFCHIDNDAFFNKALPTTMTESDVCIQSWDDTMHNHWYFSTFADCVKNTKNEYPYDIFHNSKNRVRYAGCMSLYWCQDLEMNSLYTNRFLDIMETPYYKSLPNSYKRNSHFNVLFEQMMMSEQYYQMYGKLHSVILEKNIYNEKNIANFTHIWGTKGDSNKLAGLINTIKHNMPEMYQRTHNFFNFT